MNNQKNEKELINMIKKIQFVVPAKEYFDTGFSDWERVQDDDKVLVSIDFENEKAEYIWYGNGESPTNFPSEQDDFEGVLGFFEELKEKDEDFIYEVEIEYEAKIESTLDQALHDLDIALAELGFDWDGIDTSTIGDGKVIDYYKDGNVVFSIFYKDVAGYLCAYTYSVFI